MTSRPPVGTGTSLIVALVLGATFAVASWVVLGHTWRVLEYDQPLVVYNTPVVVLFVWWLLDVDWRSTTHWQRVLAALVVVAALIRSQIVHPIVHLPVPWSGHALIASLIFVTTRTKWIALAAALIMVQVVTLKLRFNDVSWLYGLPLGTAAGLAFTRGRLRWRA